MDLVFIWRPGVGGPFWSHVFGRETPFGTGGFGLGADLQRELFHWNLSYSEDKLPLKGGGDPLWISAGLDLLAEARRQLDERCQIVVTDRWWDDPPSGAGVVVR